MFSRDLTVLPAHPAFIRYRNEPYLPLPSQPKLVLIYRPRRDGRLSWPWVAGWLHTEIVVVVVVLVVVAVVVVVVVVGVFVVAIVFAPTIHCSFFCAETAHQL